MSKFICIEGDDTITGNLAGFKGDHHINLSEVQHLIVKEKSHNSGSGIRNYTEIMVCFRGAPNAIRILTPGHIAKDLYEEIGKETEDQTA